MGVLEQLRSTTHRDFKGWLALTWIIHDFAGGKRKGALKD
jgi:hypothetical protein